MKRTLLLLLAGLMLLFSGCVGQGGNEQGLSFYFVVSGDENTGSSIRGEVDPAVSETVPAVMSRLFSGPRDASLRRTFPSGTALLGWRLEDGVLILDLSEGFGQLSGIALTQAVCCIVLTATQLDGVNGVNITVDGNRLPGIPLEALTAENAVLKGETEDPITVSSQLYFPLLDGSGLGVEYREFEVTDDALLTQANGVLEQLMDGPKENEMSHFLAGAGVLEVVGVENEICFVELNSQTMACVCGEIDVIPLHLYALVDSLIELEGIRGVTFLTEGAPIDGWWEEYTAVYEFN